MQVITPSTLIDDISSAHVLKDRLPPGRIETFVEAVADVRAAAMEAKKVSTAREVYGINDSGNWMRICSVPLSVVAAIEKVDPYFWRDKKKVYTWLGRHPEYQTAKFKRLG